MGQLMPKIKSKIAIAVLLTSGVLGGSALATAQDGEVQRILDRYRSFRPADNDLAIFQLDWVPSLNEAREKAARERRPILLMVVTNSYGNVYTGHC
jgi:hypothetical protein